MDDSTIQDSRLTDALGELRTINQWLGGYATSFAGIRPHLKNHRSSQLLTILDIGCGGGDFAEAVLTWADRIVPEIEVHVTGIDISNATVQWASNSSIQNLSPRLANRVHYQTGSAFELGSLSEKYDIVHCSLFMHHFSNDDIVLILKQMLQAARKGIVVNDLHRHPVAFDSIRMLTAILGASAMVRHDGPLSVRRAFKKDELKRVAAAAGLRRYCLTWHWAFRWLLTSVNDDDV